MLPYQTLEEAQISVGRNLTFGETLWFKYSAQKSDYLLYCHNTLFFFIFYTLVPLPWVMIQRLRSHKFDRFKIQPRATHSLSEMIHCYTKVLLTFVYSVCPLQILSYPIIKWIGIRTSLALPSWGEMLSQVLVYFLVEDYANYWLHRMLHCKWGYDKIHRVHHQYLAPMVFAAPYAHWAEVLILGFASFLGPLMVPCHMITFWLWFILRQIEAIETHSGYEFPWSPSKYIPFYGGAIYHDYHHFVGESCNSNFASVFTYCDTIYGTNKGYQYQKRIFEKREKGRRRSS
ncbi:methylsterol monooxygenase 1-1-like [Ipomoea triloba]|uniref:methylsterol monooxygenase 1-1-like n=1 Tax=Ipomoea triloba TaxID=35885 RepID=UPI00125D40D8|nr:methylsterol monooxygenase 1-1-like [Ipomoea triloba]